MVELVWTGPTNLLFDVQYRASLTDSNGWETAEAYVDAAVGSNVWSDVPLLAGPLYNSETFYRIQGLETILKSLDRGAQNVRGAHGKDTTTAEPDSDTVHYDIPDD